MNDDQKEIERLKDQRTEVYNRHELREIERKTNENSINYNPNRSTPACCRL